MTPSTGFAHISAALHESADMLRKLAHDSRLRAQEAWGSDNVDRHPVWREADQLYQHAERAFADGDYEDASYSWEEAEREFERLEFEGREQREPALVAQSMAQESLEHARKVGAPSYAADDWKYALEACDRAQASLDAGQFETATEEWNVAAIAFDHSTALALEKEASQCPKAATLRTLLDEAQTFLPTAYAESSEAPAPCDIVTEALAKNLHRVLEQCIPAIDRLHSTASRNPETTKAIAKYSSAVNILQKTRNLAAAAADAGHPCPDALSERMRARLGPSLVGWAEALASTNASLACTTISGWLDDPHLQVATAIRDELSEIRAQATEADISAIRQAVQGTWECSFEESGKVIAVAMECTVSMQDGSTECRVGTTGPYYSATYDVANGVLLFVDANEKTKLVLQPDGSFLGEASGFNGGKGWTGRLECHKQN
jgi:hypothetical protein